MSFVGHSPIYTLSRSHTGLPAAKCAEALGAHPPGTGGCVGRWAGEDLEGARAVRQAGQMALPTLHCCGSLRDSAHTASALVGCSHHVGLPWQLPEGHSTAESALSHKEHSALRSYKVTDAQPLPHSSCATWHWPGSVYSGIYLWPHPGQVSTHVPKLGGVAAGGPWALERLP